MTTETRSLHRKLAQVMYEAESIPKNGTAPAAMGGFKFVQVGDAARVIRKALAEKNVSMIPTAVEVVGETEHPTSSGKMMTTLTIRTTWTLTDGESGEIAVIQSMGSGADMGDKAAPKAQSNAMKYALLMGFLLSTGDDPELSDSSDRRPRRAGGNYETPPDEATTARLAGHDPGGIVGVIEESKAWAPHYAPKIDPVHGFIVEFKLKGDGRGGGIKVQAHGLLAEQLSDIGDDLTGQRVTAWGPIRDETFRPSGAKRDVTYQVLQLERIAGPFGTLPGSPSLDELRRLPKVSPLRDPEQDVVDAIPVAEGQEALFDAAESARIDAEEAAKG